VLTYGTYMIQLSNGHVLEYVASAGALAFDGRGWPWEHPLRWVGIIDPTLFTPITKTLTAAPREGNLKMWHPWTCIKLIPGGSVVAVALTNPGLPWWIRHIGPRINRKQQPQVCSILGDTPQEVASMAESLNSVDLAAVEINASCPNVSSSNLLTNSQAVIEACQLAKGRCRHPLLLKLKVTHDAETIVPAVASYIEALDINLVPWQIVYPGRKSPLERLGGGGVSGRAAQEHNWAFMRKLIAIGSIPVIGPGVWDYADIARIREQGAKAVSFGSIFMTYPWRPTAYVRRDIAEHRST
jgi:dihydroorotate dehydrogenase (NAD+) catalytic subunit